MIHSRFISLWTVNRIWSIPSLYRYSSSTFSLLKSQAATKKTATSRSKEGIVSHSSSLFGSREESEYSVYSHLNSLPSSVLLCGRERLKTGGSPRTTANTVTELEHAEMYEKMGREMCLSCGQKTKWESGCCFRLPKVEFFRNYCLNFFPLGGIKILLLAVFEDSNDICFLIVLRNLPELLPPFNENSKMSLQHLVQTPQHSQMHPISSYGYVYVQSV